MALYDASGNVISAGGASSIISPGDITGAVRNVFDLSQNTEENAYLEHGKAYQHDTGRYWGGAGDYAGAYFSYLIPVKPGEKYYLQNINVSASNEASAIFFTGDKELTTQSGTLCAGGNYITVPATAAFMRVPVRADTVDTVMVLSGTENPLDIYVPYGYIVPELYGNVGNKGIAWEKLAVNAKPHRFYGAKVGCLGDSLTEMGSSWQARLKSLMGFASITNYGVSGTTVTSARGEGETTYRDRAPNMADDLDLIIVMTSINDNDAPYEDSTEGDEHDVSTVEGAGLALIEILRNKYPGKDIVFFGNPHCHWGWSLGASDMYRKVCGLHAVPFFDATRFCGMDGKVQAEKDAYYTDGIHLTAAGNDRIADYMAACLRTL